MMVLDHGASLSKQQTNLSLHKAGFVTQSIARYSKFLHVCNTQHNSTKAQLLCRVWLHYYEAS